MSFFFSIGFFLFFLELVEGYLYYEKYQGNMLVGVGLQAEGGIRFYLSLNICLQ